MTTETTETTEEERTSEVEITENETLRVADRCYSKAAQGLTDRCNAQALVRVWFQAPARIGEVIQEPLDEAALHHDFCAHHFKANKDAVYTCGSLFKIEFKR